MGLTHHPEGPKTTVTSVISRASLTAPDQPVVRDTMLPPVAPSSATLGSRFGLVITNDGCHWHGTFLSLVNALLSDLVPEGAVEASVCVAATEGDALYTGWIIGFDRPNHRIDWHDGTSTDLHDLITLGI